MANEFLQDEWSYTGNPSAVPRDHLRELIGDTDPNKKKVSDSRVANALAEKRNIYFAAASLCRQLAAQYADRPDYSGNGVSENWSSVRRTYEDLAKSYEKEGQDLLDSASGGSGRPQAINHSVAALESAYDDTDRNWGPIARAGSMLDSRYDPEL